MDCELITLGFLMSGPKTGYKLKKLATNGAPFYEISLNQIYPTLRKLEKDGCLEKEVVPQNGRPDKNIFTITPKGRTCFKEKLTADPLPMTYGLPFTERAYFFRFLGPEKIIDVFEREIESLGRQLEEIEREKEAIHAVLDVHGRFSFDTAAVFIRSLRDWYRQELDKRKNDRVDMAVQRENVIAGAGAGSVE